MLQIVKKHRIEMVMLLSIGMLFASYLMTNRTGICVDYYVLAGAAVLIFVIGAGIYAGERHKGWKPEQLFLIVFIPVALAMMASIPLGRIPDEVSHLMRSWQVSIGEWFPNSENNGVFWQPINLETGWSEDENLTLSQLFTLSDQELNTQEYIQSKHVCSNTGVYPVNSYFPQAFFMLLMRLVTSNRLLILYAARLGGLTVTTALLYYAIRRLPYGKYICMTICLFPTMLQQAASASADGMTCGFTFAFLAVFLDIWVNRPKLKKWDIIVLLGLALGICTFKIMYFPMIFLLLAIPTECYGSNGEKNWVTGLLLTLCIGVVVGWLLLCKRLYADTAVDASSKEGNMIPQIMFILRNPLRYFEVIVKTLIPDLFDYAMRMFGRELAWPNVFLPKILSGIQLLAVSAVYLGDNVVNKRGRLRLSAQIVGLSALSVLVVFTALYVYFNPYQNDTVIGVQGRYFLPVILGVLLAVKLPCKTLENEILAETAVSLLALLDISVVLCAFIQLWS